MGCEANWEVPLSYRGVLDEVREVHRRAGLFDVSHFGRIRIRGDGALELLERACTADVAHQEDNTSIPTLLCNQRGGIIDYCRLIRLSNFWVLVSSPLARQSVLEHLGTLADEFDAKVDDQTAKTSLLEVTGPATADILDAVLPFCVGDLPDGTVKFGSLMVARYIAERVSASGEWGVAVSIPNMLATQAWGFITGKAGSNAVAPCGMGARDVLRIEAGLLRFGHEFNQTVDPITASLEDCVDFSHDFLGAEAIGKLKAKGPARKLIGLVLGAPEGDACGDHIPKQGTEILRKDGSEAGIVTSGAFSPTLEAPIALGYVGLDTAEVGTELLIKASERTIPAEIRALPFVTCCE